MYSSEKNGNLEEGDRVSCVIDEYTFFLPRVKVLNTSYKGSDYRRRIRTSPSTAAHGENKIAMSRVAILFALFTVTSPIRVFADSAVAVVVSAY